MPSKRNIIAFRLAFIAGVLLILSGSTGVAGIIALEGKIQEYVSFEFLPLLFSILLVIASLGGFAVIAGGWVISKHKVFWGRVLITLGSGTGLVIFIISTFFAIVSKQLVLTWLFSVGGLGIAFAIAAQLVAKPNHPPLKVAKKVAKKVFKKLKK
jgi:hypothetical protein